MEQFLVSLITRIHRGVERARDLRAAEFPAEGPAELADTIERLGRALIDALLEIAARNPWAEEDTDLLQQDVPRAWEDAEFILQGVELVSSDRVPAEMYGPVVALARKFHENARVVLWTEPDYNYSIIPTDIFLVLAQAFGSIILNPSVMKSCLEHEKNGPIFLISLAAAERPNIFGYVLLGHEIGHLAAESILRDEKAERVTRDLVARLTAAGEQNPKALVPDAMEVRRRALEELIADTVGVHLLGPAMLFACWNLAAHEPDGLDLEPTREHEWYPPWRTRLRHMHEYLTAMNGYSMPQATRRQAPAPLTIVG